VPPVCHRKGDNGGTSFDQLGTCKKGVSAVVARTNERDNSTTCDTSAAILKKIRKFDR
jgi:hypothetical protein